MNITVRRLAELATRHVLRYRTMIQAGNAGNASIRVGECRYYLAIWQAVDQICQGPLLSDTIDWDWFTADQRMEIYDALHDEGVEVDEIA